MIKKDLLLLILATVLAVLTACDRNGSICPAFPEQEEAWLPYRIGEWTSFHSDRTEYSFPIENVMISQEQHFTRDWGYACTPTMLVLSGLDSLNLITVSATISYQDGDIDPGYLPLHVRITAYERNVLDLMELGRDDFHCDPQGEYWSLSGDTLVIQSLDPEIFSELTLVRGQGLVSAVSAEL